MNTAKMLQDAVREAQISRASLRAHVLCALVFQMGRPYMRVGEVKALVKKTSGKMPSTYQVNKLLSEFCEAGLAFSASTGSELRTTRRYHAADNAVFALMCEQWQFADSSEMWNGIENLTRPIRNAAIDTINTLVGYNEGLDTPAIEVIND